ncbi:hypothetical protein SAMN05443543_105261 [Flavobacterium flevense]|uniref:Outer membrane protein beta-barrel domain-containing protein n=1 Tax=Flavobacterium flevense TaxID=983 RepID=A0A4Y4AXS0_9FLAO|nr:hypothetical protein [Flavobacterium flevense]GEC71850.1 hypothetical protein FFL01_13890 [Flavobacterium flevense]SHL83441.1 hypothetical protein SAMN05443543_105261 [Flavobacterium flevense]
MKKIILTAAALFAFGFANAQSGSFKLGAHVGLPTGDIKDFSSVNLGADVSYTWSVAEGLDVGIATGYSNYLGKTVDVEGFGSFKAEDSGFVPIAATGQITLTNNLFVGADLGYAIFTGSDNGSDGGFYYQPKFGYQMNVTGIYVSYKGISVDGATFSSVNLGVNFKL